MAPRISDDESGELSDINVTPFVDVVLVLLVIFMIATPALVKDSLRVELPKSASTDLKAPRSLGVVVTRAGQVLVEGQPVTEEALIPLVKRELQVNSDLQALIAADEESQHKELVRVMDLLKRAGLQKFALEVKRVEP